MLFLSRPSSASPALGGVCDLLIPAFNRPDQLRDLIASLERHTNRELLSRIWIGDDTSDSFSAAEFKRLCDTSSLPITLIRHEKNLGFGGNCNALLSRVRTPYCILLNTDVLVPPFWLERMLTPLRTMDNVALATPFSTQAANHTIRLHHGQSWIDADRDLAASEPCFPDDCTAIGFCMGMNVDLLRRHDLCTFDPAFGRGYGEDTDLHYRVVSAGLRSVIVDHLLVHHAGASSFATLVDEHAIRAKGREVFLSRWGQVHEKSHAAFEAASTLSRLIEPTTGALRHRRPITHIDVLFVLPSTHLRYGGVWFVAHIIRHLILCGIRAAAYVQNPDNILADTQPFGFSVFRSEDQLKAEVSSLGCVVSTSDWTIRPALSLSEFYRCTEVLFLQCMEVCFRSGISVDTFLQYRRIPHVVTVSDALREYIELIHPGVNASMLPLGPDPLVFYQRDTKRIPRTVAVAMNDIPEKGYAHALEFALLLREQGFHITFFGWDHERNPMLPEIGDVMQDTSREALADLFSRTEFLIDHSYLEGLGLLPLEAAFCGCIPILATTGAPEYFFRDGYDCIKIDGYRSRAEKIRKISTLTKRQKDRLRRHALRHRDRRSLPLGLAASLPVFSRLAGMVAIPVWKSIQEYCLASTLHQE